MTGEKDLENLLRDMEPKIEPGRYVFCSVEEQLLAEIDNPLLVFREREGPTIIVTKETAETLGLEFTSEWGLITLSVHSSLEAVGFLAAVTHHLAKANISVNAVSAFYHDHLFVPYDMIEEAHNLLVSISDPL